MFGALNESVQLRESEVYFGRILFEELGRFDCGLVSALAAGPSRFSFASLLFLILHYLSGSQANDRFAEKCYRPLRVVLTASSLCSWHVASPTSALHTPMQKIDNLAPLGSPRPLLLGGGDIRHRDDFRVERIALGRCAGCRDDCRARH